ncbi:MAG TPA: single-stranded-DNA-specific exonuclease RecJ [bacterium]|nr:single-stranded-DNA-specific exonuclease RecJ [bacterium]
MTDIQNRDQVHDLAARLGVPVLIARMLVSRGVTTFEAARRFFRPAWEDLYDPFLMADMDKAVERISRALNKRESIFIYGDYDVDGITSVSLLTLFLRRLGANVFYYIPERLKEGYGLSLSGVRQAVECGTTLMITVDCGITGIEEVKQARESGIDVIVSDHHEPGAVLPDAVAVLDPKRADCPYPFKELAGVGVAFKLIQAVSRFCGLEESVPAEFIDLVALGSAADIVPLVDENRVLVFKGMEKINRFERLGIRALAETSGLLDKKIGTGQLVFIMAPRINAVGRLGNAERAAELLITDSETRAREIAKILEQENQTRKNIDEETFRQALALMESENGEKLPPAVVLSQYGWHSGVIGIVASRIVEKVYRPTIMIAVEDGVGKGSARSIPNFDIYSAIRQCEPYLMGFGGHKYAAGLTIAPENIEAFSSAFLKAVESVIDGDDLVERIHVDSEISLDEITDKFIRLLNLFAPFGPQNMRPVFLSRNLQVVGTPGIVGKDHLKFRVRQEGKIFDAIGFGLGSLRYRLTPGEANLDMIYVIEENIWNGQSRVQLRVKDLR